MKNRKLLFGLGIPVITGIAAFAAVSCSHNDKDRQDVDVLANTLKSFANLTTSTNQAKQASEVTYANFAALLTDINKTLELNGATITLGDATNNDTAGTKTFNNISISKPGATLNGITLTITGFKPTTQATIEINNKPYFKVTSTSIDSNFVFKDNILKGSAISPQLTWDKIKDAKSYAIILVDKESTSEYGYPFVHWVAFTQTNSNSLIEGASGNKNLLLEFNNSTVQSSKLSTSLVSTNLQKPNSQAFYGPNPTDTDHNYEIQIVPLKEVVTEEIANTVMASGNFGINSLSLAEQLIGRFQVGGGFGKITASSPKIDSNGNIVADANLKGNFYKDIFTTKVIQNVTIDKLEAQSAGPDLLDRKYISTFNKETKVFSNPSSNEILNLTFNKVEPAKSYVVLINNSQDVNTYAVPLNNFTAYGISQPSTDKITVAINPNLAENTNYKVGQNSFSYANSFTTSVQGLNLAQSAIFSKTPFSALAPNKGNTGFYRIFVFALDVESNDAMFSDSNLNSGTLLQKIKGHVIAENTAKVFRIKPAA
ncbi:Raf kinase inhibitor-like YbhB/YbcL family protein [Mycoplasma testudineum]|uniref:Raf kinase inhibitor-like YbhB/YbcL family protein n=1 Tax=Mycoplasma testudineum TaxID=244584 RepID=A0A4R6IBF4_9MOLU|nr:hypothetical protein [Mycoplasma testudineum]OYD26528.1 hypothetical protein CG473_03365 [Mycoplasma testudineum]TDO19134.1 Raf kinase inhibitor-like YbhB/YbcL family protein [Mycoplasma testudineum]